MMISLIALVFAMGGFAVAAIPDGDGTIHACYKKEKGTLRAVSSARKCRENEHALSWNQRGRTGAPGAQGPKGDAGSNGDPGGIGSPGASGTARAYVRAFADGTLDAPHTKNVTSVDHPSTGIYCINLAPGVDPSNTLPSVSTDFNGASQQSTAQARRTNSDCAAGQLEVRTYVWSSPGGVLTATLADQAFFAVIP
jgi:hypothetical protein